MDVLEQIKEKQAALTELLEKGISTDEDRAAMTGLLGTIETLKSAVGAQDALDKMKGIVGGTPETKAAPTLADQIFESDGMKSGSDFRVDVPSMARAALGVKAQPLVTTATSGAGQELLTRTDLGITVTPDFRLPTLMNLVTRGTSDADSIRWVEMAFTNNAAVVTEATGATGGGGTGGLKPDSQNSFVERTANSQTIAHLKYVTRQALRNRGYLMGLIEGEMIDGLAEKAEDLLWNDADYGVLNVSGVQVQPFVTSIQKTILSARSLVIQARATPQAVILNPIDAINVYSATDSGGWFYQGGPVDAPVARLWGIPIVETDLCPAGEAFVGDFSTLHIDVVEDPNTVTTNSHLDFFARNIEAIRAEMAAIIRFEKPAQVVRAAVA